MKWLSKCYVGLIFLMLYAPLIVLVVFSFNEAGNLGNFSGVSFKWYRELFKDRTALSSLRNSVILATSAAAISTVIGTLAAFGLDRMRSKYLRSSVEAVSNIPMMNPDIVTGVSMMLMFAVTVSVLKLTDGFMGFPSMLIAHVTFCLPYVVLSIMPKYKQLDRTLCDAAMDLGCTPVQTFFKVELPAILPGIVSGLMLSFSLSLDDFVISHFVAGKDFITLPLYVYNQTSHSVKFSTYALCSIMIFVILALLILVNFLSSIGEKRNRKTKRKSKF